MKTDLISVGSCQKKVQVHIPAADVQREVNLAYRDLSHKVRLPGFRPGKAPRKVLEMRFKSQVNGDVASKLLQEAWAAALTEHKIEPVGRPEVEQGDLDPKADFEFSITVDVRPEIELEHYTDVEVEYPLVEVPEEEVDQLVSVRLEGQARLIEVEGRAVQAGDMVLTELTAKDGDDVVVNEPGTMIKTDGEPYYPGVEALLIGLAIGEEKSDKVTFTDEARTEDIQGRELDVTAKVLSIQANEIPELTDEIASELGYEGGIDGMREALRAELAGRRDEMARNQARANLLRVLIDLNEFDVPKGMVDQQFEALLEELKLQAAYTGRDPRTIDFSGPEYADLPVRAEFAVKGGLILDWVSRNEGVEVTDEDLEKKYQELADDRDQSIEAIKGYFAKENMIDELRARMLEEKTLEWLLERAKLVEPKPVEAGDEPADTAADAPAADVDIPALLKLAVGKIKTALGTGDYDVVIADVLAAEEAGKARKGALAAIKSRM